MTPIPSSECPCGGKAIRMTWDGDRSITIVPSGITEAPFVLEYDCGHTSEQWTTSEQIRDWLLSQ